MRAKSEQLALLHSFQIPRACLVEFHARGYKQLRLSSRCHELVSWSFTLRATVAANVKLHETSSWHLSNSSGKRETPRDKLVASLDNGRSFSGKRENPRDKLVASVPIFV